MHTKAWNHLAIPMLSNWSKRSAVQQNFCTLLGNRLYDRTPGQEDSDTANLILP